VSGVEGARSRDFALDDLFRCKLEVGNGSFESICGARAERAYEFETVMATPTCTTSGRFRGRSALHSMVNDGPGCIVPIAIATVVSQRSAKRRWQERVSDDLGPRVTRTRGSLPIRVALPL